MTGEHLVNYQNIEYHLRTYQVYSPALVLDKHLCLEMVSHRTWVGECDSFFTERLACF